MTLVWLDCKGRDKPWVAAIRGLDQKYGLAREFLAPVDKRDGSRAYVLEPDTLYQVEPADGPRDFLIVRDGKVVRLTTEEAMEIVGRMEADKKKREAAVDEAIGRVRFNAEGGFSQN